jgi:hypothetical protein
MQGLLVVVRKVVFRSLYAGEEQRANAGYLKQPTPFEFSRFAQINGPDLSSFCQPVRVGSGEPKHCG